MQTKILAMVAAVVVVGAGAWYAYQLDKPEPRTETIKPVSKPQPVIRDIPQPGSVPDESSSNVREAIDPQEFVPLAKQEPIVEPPAQVPGSDSVVYRAIEDLAANLAPWFTPSDQIDKWVLAVDLMASGNMPSKHLPVAINMGQFKVVKDEQGFAADPANFDRATALIDAVTAIPPQKLVRYYQAWRPLLEQSYRELGKPGSFDARLQEAIEQILAAPSPSGSPVLVRPSVMYQYANENLEKAPPLTRWLWRLGPENTRKIQTFLIQLKPLL